MITSPPLLDTYESHEHVGNSDTAEVWKARDTHQQCSVTIKVLPADLQADPDYLPHFLHEAARIASLHHPNIVQVRDFRISRSPLPTAEASEEKTLLVDPASAIGYIVMEYIEGQTLADYIQNTSHQGKFPPAAEIVHLLMPISLAIDYAHQQGMIHGHLKPTNILLDESNTTVNLMGEPMLTDFGTTHLLKTSSNSPQDISPYTAPEQAEGHADNERSDLYSLGVILYEIFTGVPPFEGDNPDDTRTKLINTSPTSPVLINPTIPPALTVVILRSLAKDPAARYPNAAAMVVALAKAVNVPVPESLHAASIPVDATDTPTYLHPLRSPEMRPSSPSFPGVPISTVDTATIPAGEYQPTARKKPRQSLYIALIALLLVVMVGSSGAYFILSQNNAAIRTVKPLVIGHAFFLSSGILSPNSAQGITDQLQLTLQNIPNPASGKRYYAWLLNDKGADPAVTPPISLGQLQVSQGTINLAYPGTTDHKDLLANYSRFLITEEDASAPPSIPSLDSKTWRYYAGFSAVPNPADTVNHYSLRDHLRHLLAEDPKLKAAGLSGGLDIWFFRNTEKILEWSGSARDTTNTQLIHRQVVRILDYLDGETYIGKDIPAGTPLYVDPTIARIPLLQSVQGQTPPPTWCTSAIICARSPSLPTSHQIRLPLPFASTLPSITSRPT